MKLFFPFSHWLRPAMRLGLFSALFFLNSFVTTSATELLVEWSQGGPHQYTGSWGPVAVGFSVEEPIRIERVEMWMAGSGLVKASIFVADLADENELFSKTFTAREPTSTPALWQGVGSLQWDLQPLGLTYYLSFDNGAFPFGLPNEGPVSPHSQRPTDYLAGGFEDRWDPTDAPLGVRIYGSPLSAIPEPATYGLIGGVMLIGLAAFRRRTSRVRDSRA